MKKLLLILLCLPMIGFGQYEVEKGSQERIDISNAIRTSFGTEYLCVYSQLEVLDRFAFASFKLIHKLTNKFMKDEEFSILLINDFDKGWQVYNKDCWSWDHCLDGDKENYQTFAYFSEIHFKNGNYFQAIKSINEIIFWAEPHLDVGFSIDDYFYDYIKYEFRCQNKSLIPVSDTLFACIECKELYTHSYLLEEAYIFYESYDTGDVSTEYIIWHEAQELRNKYLTFAIKEYNPNINKLK